MADMANQPTTMQEASAIASSLLAVIADTVKSLQVTLDPSKADELYQNAAKLVNVSKVFRDLSQSLEQSRKNISEWIQDHSAAVQECNEVKDALGSIKEHVESGLLHTDDLRSVLAICDQAINLNSRHTIIRQRLIETIQQQQYDLAPSLTRDATKLQVDFSKAIDSLTTVLSKIHKSKESEDPTESNETEPLHEETISNETTADQEPAVPSELRSPTATITSDDLPIEPKTDSTPITDKESENLDNRKEPKPLDASKRPAHRHENHYELEQLETQLSKALEQRRFGVVYHIARRDTGIRLNQEQVKLIAINYVTADIASVAGILPELASAIHDQCSNHLSLWEDESSRIKLSVLLVSAALRPSLIAPGGPVAQLIEHLATNLESLPSLQSLATSVARISLEGIHVPMDLLLGKAPIDNWNDRLEDLKKETKEWISAETQSTVKSYVATKVWRRMIDPKPHRTRPSLGRVLQILSNCDDQTDFVDTWEIATRWQDNKDKEIDRVDRSLRAIRGNRRIEGAARVGLRKKISEASGILDDWNVLIHSKPKQRSRYQDRLARQLSHAIGSFAEESILEIEKLTSEYGQCSIALIDRFASLFSGDLRIAEEPRLSLEDLLNGDLLSLPDFSIGSDGEIATSYSLDTLLRLLTSSPEDFVKSALEQARIGNFETASMTIDYAIRSQMLDDEKDSEEWKGKLDQARDEFITRLCRKASMTEQRLDAAYAIGAIESETLDNLRRDLPPTDQSYFTDDDDFRALISSVDQIDERISQAKDDFARGMRRRLEALESVSGDHKDRIEQLINVDRFVVAEHYIDQLENGEEVFNDSPLTSSGFDEFFPKFLEKYSDFRNRNEAPLIIIRDALSQRSELDLHDVSCLSAEICRRRVRLIESWLELRGTVPGNWSVQRQFLEQLGFMDVSKAGEIPAKDGRQAKRKIAVRPIASRRVARLPDFGSRTNGRYTLAVLRDGQTAQGIVHESGPWVAQASPIIILLFNVLDASERRSLATEMNSGDYHPTLVIDEALLAFLAVSSAETLATFFSCTSPFSYANPYDPDSPSVPPEMFFGRQMERKRILAMTGDVTHFVYGGRRLGKTAILADVARRNQFDDKNDVRILANLRGSGIGEDRPTNEIWRLISEHLADHGVIKKGIRQPKTIVRSVRKWLDDLDGRRILFLVDEADLFLDAERNFKARRSYQELERLKDLMESTNRQFKVVFAGLHNVQRVARDPNTPIAHLGTPVRIGPMLPETDRGEIEKLIQSPLAAMGYRFECPDTVTRIAAETNYYPALAQQYCKELLLQLRASLMYDSKGPPYIITSEHVDRVFNSKDTRDRIRNLFQWTIQLDPRYQFLTYLIAYHSFDGVNGRMSEVSINHIRDEALREWYDGFSSDDSYAMFEALLDEMVGLGILRQYRREGPTTYSIRSRNLKMLLGQEDEIERRLIDAINNNPPLRYSPAQLRQTLKRRSRKGRKVERRLSCLTASQEGVLQSKAKEAVFIFGTKLAGIDRVYDALKDMIHRIRQYEDERDLRVYLRQAQADSMVEEFAKLTRQRQRRSGIEFHFVLIDLGDRWLSDKIHFVLKTVSGLAGRNRIIRPVFVGGPTSAWKWLCGGRQLRAPNVEMRDLWLGPCARDFARKWLADHAGKTYVELEDLKSSADSLWPVVIETALKSKDSNRIDDATERALGQRRAIVRDVLTIRGMEGFLKALAVVSDMSVDEDDLYSLVEDDRDHTEVYEWTERVLEWSRNLGIVLRDHNGYRLDAAWATGLMQVFYPDSSDASPRAE